MGAFLVRKRLVDRFMAFCSVCLFYRVSEEDEFHLFFAYDFVVALWFALPWSIRWDAVMFNHDVGKVIATMFEPDSSLPVLYEDIPFFQVATTIVIEHIWFSHNKLIFHG